MAKKNPFDLTQLFQDYLKRAKAQKLPPAEIKLLERGFMAACGQMLNIMKHDLPRLEDDLALDQIDRMSNQAANYALQDGNRLN